jgi:outer membrane receptor protein involved in Fe transport
MDRIKISVGFVLLVFWPLIEVNAQVIQLPEIEVIANTIVGTGVPLSEIPTNAQILKEKDIAEQGTNNLANLLDNNLGSVSVSNGTGNPYQNDVNYRGFQATSLLGAPVGLSVHIDGIRMNEPFGATVNWDLIPMNAISTVNVLPGSNPMFGLNTLGGSLVINTKNGKDNLGTVFNITGGSFARRSVSMQIGWMNVEKKTDYFISANYDKQNGFRHYTQSEVGQVFAKMRWFGDQNKTRIDLSGAFSNSNLNGTQALPMDMLSNIKSAYTFPDNINNRMGFINLKASHWLTETNQMIGQLYYRHAELYNVNSNARLDDGCFVTSGDPTSGLALSNGVVKCANMAPNGTAVNSVTSANALALGFGQWNSSINTSLADSATMQKTVGVSLQSSYFDELLGHENSLTWGGSLDQSNINYSQNSYLAKLVNYQTVVTSNQEYGFTNNGLVPSTTNLPSFNASNVLTGVNLSSTTKNLSLYLTNTFHVTDKLNVTGSGSFNYTSINQTGSNSQYLNDDGGFSWTDSITGISYYNPSYTSSYKYSNTTTSGAAAAANNIPTGYIAGPETNSLSGAHHFQRFNPAIGYNYKINEMNGVFGSYSQSMRAPTSVELSCANPNNPCLMPSGFNSDPDLKAVVAQTVEIGGRGKILGKVNWNAALYNSRLSNDIQFLAAPNSTTYGYFSNVGSTERRGFEMGLQTRIQNWFLSGNLGFVNAIYKSNFTTSGGESVSIGDVIPGIPRSTLKLRTAYTFSSQSLIAANLKLVSSQLMHGNESNADPKAKVAGYGLLNLDFHHRVTKELSFFTNINNLFNKQYSTYGQSGITSIYTLASQNFITPASTRAVWLGFTYTFDTKRLKLDD